MSVSPRAVENHRDRQAARIDEIVAPKPSTSTRFTPASGCGTVITSGFRSRDDQRGDGGDALLGSRLHEQIVARNRGERERRAVLIRVLDVVEDHVRGVILAVHRP